MSKEIIDFLRKQDSIFTAAKYFGGIEELKNFAKNNPKLYDYVKNSLGGYLTLKSDNGKKYKFKFYIVDYDLDDESHLFVIIDVVLKDDIPNLEEIGIWLDSYCEDGRPIYYFNDPYFNQTFYILGRVDSVNGVKIPDGSRLEDETTIIPDEKVETILKDNITETLKKLQNILKNP